MHRYLDRFRFFWDLFESEIIRAEPGTPITMKTKFGYVLSGPMSKVQNNEGSTLICRSLKFGTEICDSDSILQKKSKICGRLNALTLKIERFDSKADSFTVYKSFCDDIRYNSNEARYEV